MKIIHTSDWHLGARLREEDRSDEHRAFLGWLLDLMAAERPDALLVAGDVFDVKAPSPAAQRLYYGFLAAAVKVGTCGKIVVTAGNHDSAGLLAAPARLLSALDVVIVARAPGRDTGGRSSPTAAAGDSVADEIVEVKDPDGATGLVIAAMPFMYEAELANFGAAEVPADAPRETRVAAGWRRHCADAIAAARARAPGAPVVATGHCTVVGADVSDDESERGRRIGGLDALDVSPLAAADYVALGHLHRPQAVKGYESKAFYSGSPLRMSFDEATGVKSVNVVTFAGAGAPPEVRRVEVPQTVPILTIEGTPDRVRSELGALAADRDTLRYVRLRLKGFDGAARPHWEALRALAAGTRTLVLEECDMRPVSPDAAGLKAFAGRRIQEVCPRDVAERKLMTSRRNFSADEVAGFMKLFDAVAAEVAGGAP